MNHKHRSILPVFLTLASAISAQVLMAALAMVRNFLRDTPWERIAPLARQFRDVMEQQKPWMPDRPFASAHPTKRSPPSIPIRSATCRRSGTPGRSWGISRTGSGMLSRSLRLPMKQT